VQLGRQQCCVTSCDCLLRVLPPSRATNFHVANSRRRFYSVQHENLLRAAVVIRATNNLKLQRKLLRDTLHENVARITGPEKIDLMDATDSTPSQGSGSLRLRKKSGSVVICCNTWEHWGMGHNFSLYKQALVRKKLCSLERFFVNQLVLKQNGNATLILNKYWIGWSKSGLEQKLLTKAILDCCRSDKKRENLNYIGHPKFVMSLKFLYWMSAIYALFNSYITNNATSGSWVLNFSWGF